ncbi:MAG TPA: VOC family protein [Thermomicrobiales bacterium]|nr:VOC family protein [Thermomicrobiales bacterium]
MTSIQLAEVVMDHPGDKTQVMLDFYAMLTGFTPYLNETANSMLENENGVDIGLQPVEGYRGPTWPTQERGQQIHFDFATDDFEAAVTLAESMGATRAPNQGDHGWIVMLDPVGHPFCFVQHRDEIDGDRRPASEDGPSIKIRGPFIDCPDQHALAAFYLGLLGGQTIIDEDDYVVIVTETGRPLAFQRVEGYRAPTWPTQERGQQMHFDVYVDDMEEAQNRAIELGAKLVDDSHDGFHVLLDPAGHPLCLCQA